MSFRITTTGNQNPVTFNDLGGVSYDHPTIDYDLENDFKEEEIRSSDDVQNAIDSNWITVTDEFGNPITTTRGAVSHYELAGLDHDDHGQYAKTIGSRRAIINIDNTIEDKFPLVFDTTSNEMVVSDEIRIHELNDINHLHFRVDHHDPLDPLHTEGTLYYDDIDKTLVIHGDITGVSIKLGKNLVIRARNNTDHVIEKGRAVRITGASFGLPTIDYAQANNFFQSIAIGVTDNEIGINEVGIVVTQGIVRNVNMTGMGLYTGGSLFLSETTAGYFRALPPPKPNYSVNMGATLNADDVDGTIYVGVNNVWNFGESGNVKFTNLEDGNIVSYDSTAGYWVNSSIEQLSGSSGTSGTSGIDGTSGSSGSSGTSGQDGTSGSSGTSGIDGTSGTSGSSGSSGTSGSSGSSGTSAVVSPTGIWDLLDFAEVSSEGVSSTTNQAYQTKLTFTTPAITAKCRIAYTVTYSSGTKNRYVYVRFYNDTDATVIDEVSSSLANDSNWQVFTGFYYFDLTGTAKTFSIQYAVGAGTTVYVQFARIEFWRIT